MFSLKKPSQTEIRRFLFEQSKLDCSYSDLGMTAREPPAGFNVDHTRCALGTGERAFLAATEALQRWRQFKLSWLDAGPAETQIRAGEVVAILARIGILWSLNACRIVSVIDEAGTVDRFGFAYGTLPGHAEMGEERFLIEWNHADDSVCYDILAYSRPRHPLVWLGYPFARRLQKRFARDSAGAMKEAVNLS